MRYIIESVNSLIAILNSRQAPQLRRIHWFELGARMQKAFRKSAHQLIGTISQLVRLLFRKHWTVVLCNNTIRSRWS